MADKSDNFEKMKKAYQDKMEAQLRESRAEIEKLQAKADSAEAEAKIRYYKEIEMLKTKIAATESKLNELKVSTEEKWNSFKADIEASWEDLKRALKDAASRIR